MPFTEDFLTIHRAQHLCKTPRRYRCTALVSLRSLSSRLAPPRTRLSPIPDPILLSLGSWLPPTQICPLAPQASYSLFNLGQRPSACYESRFPNLQTDTCLRLSKPGSTPPSKSVEDYKSHVTFFLSQGMIEIHVNELHNSHRIKGGY